MYVAQKGNKKMIKESITLLVKTFESFKCDFFIRYSEDRIQTNLKKSASQLFYCTTDMGNEMYLTVKDKLCICLKMKFVFLDLLEYELESAKL